MFGFCDVVQHPERFTPGASRATASAVDHLLRWPTPNGSVPNLVRVAQPFYSMGYVLNTLTLPVPAYSPYTIVSVLGLEKDALVAELAADDSYHVPTDAELLAAQLPQELEKSSDQTAKREVLVFEIHLSFSNLCLFF